jgi:hypothetical protein
MGIRIHKAVGYGGIHPNIVEASAYWDENGIDGEVNQLIVENIPKADRYDHLFLETAEMAEKYHWEYPKQFWECINHTEYEISDPGYTLIIPPIYIKDWHRYDDNIDYCDSDSENPETVIKILERPIFPYRYWMDPITFELRKYEEPKLIPSIPTSVKLIAEKIGMDWKTLKPMVATWW